MAEKIIIEVNKDGIISLHATINVEYIIVDYDADVEDPHSLHISMPIKADTVNPALSLTEILEDEFKDHEQARGHWWE